MFFSCNFYVEEIRNYCKHEEILWLKLNLKTYIKVVSFKSETFYLANSYKNYANT